MSRINLLQSNVNEPYLIDIRYVFLCAGCIGFFACFWFVRKIFSRHAALQQSSCAVPDSSEKMPLTRI